MRNFDITGMNCAACSSRVEKAVKSVEGVTNCSVNLLTNSMIVEGTVENSKIISAVVEAGYGASLKGEDNKQSKEKSSQNHNTSSLLKRFLISLIFLLLLMYISMGHIMWNFPLPYRLAENYIAQGLLQFLLSATVMVINQQFFINGFKGLIKKAPNMDTLISMGSAAAFGYSTVSLFNMVFQIGSGENGAGYMPHFYFESAAMILVLITFGKMLESKAKGKTTSAIKSLMELVPETAIVLKDGKEILVSADELKKGDIFIVKPGSSIPADGVVIEGHSSVNESNFTGESIPVEKTVGASVTTSTINLSGFLCCEATAVGEDTTLSKIIKMVSDSTATKAPVAKIADRVSGVFVPIVICIAIITFLVWLFLGKTVGFAISHGISVLVISCPCALGLATPVAIMVGSGKAAKNGILFKTAVSLENTGRTNIVVLDKTGTITKGEPDVTDIVVAEGINPKEFLSYVYSLESKSEHPLATAIVKYAVEKKVLLIKVENFNEIPGKGLTAEYEGKILTGGNLNYISTFCNIPEEFNEKAQMFEVKGKTVLYFCLNGIFLGLIAVADIIKKESAEACNELKKMGIRTVMLTGDNERTAKAVANQAGITEVIAGVLPSGKEAVVKSLKEQGRVVMVGDGINDALALTSADVGIAIGAGTDIAIDAADVILVKSKLTDVPAAIRLSKATLKIIHQNLFWAFIYNVIGIPLAMGAFIELLGWELNPMFGAAAMSFSSVAVVTNALRLNLFNIYKKTPKKEKSKMEIIIKVEGMMCPHCEMHVKKALEAIKGVVIAIPSHKENQVIVKFEKQIPLEVLHQAIINAGYKIV